MHAGMKKHKHGYEQTSLLTRPGFCISACIIAFQDEAPTKPDSLFHCATPISRNMSQLRQQLYFSNERNIQALVNVAPNTLANNEKTAKFMGRFFLSSFFSRRDYRSRNTYESVVNWSSFDWFSAE